MLNLLVAPGHSNRAAWLAAAAALLLPGGLLILGAVLLYRWLRIAAR